MFEAKTWSEASFVTLTYKDLYQPGYAVCLCPQDPREFLNRLRSRLAPSPIRYYLVGEYGDEKQRAHYHLALFGYPHCAFFPEGDQESINRRRKCNCIPCTTIRNTWGLGNTDCGSLTPESASYLAGYLTKRMNHPEKKCTPKCTHPPLGGRFPEFARQSNGGGKAHIKGGIGAPAVESIASVLQTTAGLDFVLETGDVPLSLRQGKKTLPLGRYLRDKIRRRITDEKTRKIIKEKNTQKHAQEMRELYSSERANLSNTSFVPARSLLRKSFGQKILNLETRSKIWRKKGKL